MKEERLVKRLMVPLEYDKKIITKGNGRQYNGAMLLSCGEFTDSVSKTPTVYSKNELEKIPINLKGKRDIFPLDDDRIFLNIDHKYDEVLSRIGYVPNIYFLDNALRGDLFLHCLTAASNEVRLLIDGGYINYLSVEILTKDRYSISDRKIYACDISLIGVAVVTIPACPYAKIQIDEK